MHVTTGNKEKKIKLTSAGLQPRDDIIDSVLYRVGPKCAGGAQVKLDVVSATRGVGVSGHGPVIHARARPFFAWGKQIK